MLEFKPGMKAYVEHQLAEQRTPKTGPERAFTTIKFKALYNLQLRAEVEGHSFVSDEREEVFGNNAGPAPMRYFLGGVMMCHQVWTIKSAALVDVKIERLEAEMRGYLERMKPGDDPEAERGVDHVDYTVEIDSPNAADEVWTVVDQGARRCNAFVTVCRGSRINIELIHNGTNLGQRSYGSGRG
jgi:uncharacterized OsmC-like protein